MRWAALLGQGVSVGVARWLLGVPLPAAPLAWVLALGIFSNLAATAWLRGRSEVPEVALAALMGLDFVLLTLLLGFTGGPYNPFSTLYLVNIALAGIMLRVRWMFAITGLGLLGYGALFMPELWSNFDAARPLSHAEQMRTHLRAMWLSFALAAGLILYFVQRATRALAEREREQELAGARELGERRSRLASLAALAAGAAHELSTPLSTIALVSKELQRRITALALPADVAEDAALIRAEVERCRVILQDMALGAGAAPGEPWQRLSARELATSAGAGFSEGRRVQVLVPEDVFLEGPARALGRALEWLLKNAVQASAPEAPVQLAVERVGTQLRFCVRDEGMGMTPSVRARAGEPFFTTKAPGEGMGLGLFLTRALAEELGGELTLEPREPRGLEARLSLPLPRGAG